MIEIKGVDPREEKAVANAILLAVGIAGVCSEEPKCQTLGCSSCLQCAMENHIVFK